MMFQFVQMDQEWIQSCTLPSFIDKEGKGFTNLETLNLEVTPNSKFGLG